MFENPETIPQLRCTPQLFQKSALAHLTANSQEIKPIASAVLIEFEKKPYLITAKHVFSKIRPSEVIVFLTENYTVNLPDEMSYFPQTNNNDNKDIAVFQLSNTTAFGLSKRYVFLNSKYIDFNHIYTANQTYLLLGFISSQTKLTKKIFSSTPFGFITKFKSLKQPEKWGLTETDNITLSYNRRKQGFIFSRLLSIGPRDLRGLSGGGIWHIKEDSTNLGVYQYNLVGIMIEERTNRGIIIGSKIKLVLELLKLNLK